MANKNNTLQKFNDIYEYISDNIYYSKPDFAISNKAYNSALLLGLSSSALNGKIIYVGEYGLGKTTLAETISSLMYMLPKKTYSSNSIKGNPEISNEQIIGRPNLGELNKGKEKVIWSEFVLSKPKIVDEINRIPSNKQNLLLAGIQTEMWSYLNSTINIPDCPWFATKNYSDAGNTGIIPPLLDRFELAAESKSPGLNNFRSIRYNKPLEISMPDLEEEYYALLNKETFDIKEHYKNIEKIKEKFRNEIENQTGLELLTEKDLVEIKKETEKIGFTQEANFLLDAIIAELASCQLFGQKRTNQTCPQDCHFSNYACNKTENDVSTRTILAIDKYSKMMAWLDGKKEADKKHILTIAPYALWHKTKIREEYIGELDEERREEVIELEAVKKLIEEIEKRQRKIMPKQKELVKNILSGNANKAVDMANHLDHPVFKEYIKG